MVKPKHRHLESAFDYRVRLAREGFLDWSFDEVAARRDPLFWIDMALSKMTFGLICFGRYKRYITFTQP